MKKAIFVISGHSSSNPWAEYSGLKEIELVQVIAEQLADKLDSKSNITIYELIEDISLEEKVRVVNEICLENWYNLDNSILLEIHTNSTEQPNTWTWIETLIYDWFQPWLELANYINTSLAKATWLNNRWIKRWKQFYIINSSIPLAWIVECGFINTDKDRSILQNNITAFSDWIYNWLKEYIWFDEIQEINYKDMYDNEVEINKGLNKQLEDIQNILN